MHGSPVCVWHCCFPDGTSHQPVLRRPGSLTCSSAIETAPFLLPSFSLCGSLLVSVTPPSLLLASPHPSARPASSTGPVARLLLQPGLLFNTHTTPNGPVLLSWGHIYPLYSRIQYSANFYSYSWKDSAECPGCLQERKSCSGFCGVSNAISGRVGIKYCKNRSFSFSGKVAISGLWCIISDEQGAANGL